MFNNDKQVLKAQIKDLEDKVERLSQEIEDAWVLSKVYIYEDGTVSDKATIQKCTSGFYSGYIASYSISLFDFVMNIAEAAGLEVKGIPKSEQRAKVEIKKKRSRK